MSFEHCSTDLGFGAAGGESDSLLSILHKGVLETRSIAELLGLEQIGLPARRLLFSGDWFRRGVREEPASQ